MAIDLCMQIATARYALGTVADLAETADQVRQLGRKCVTVQGDVRSLTQMQAAVSRTLAAFGRLDIVLANAGIAPGLDDESEPQEPWQNVIDVCLTGVWNTLRATAPVLIEQGHGGAIVITGSSAGLRAQPGSASAEAYTAAKHGVIGLMRSFALMLAPHSVRVNTVHPSGVATPMVLNPGTEDWYQAVKAGGLMAEPLLPMGLLEPGDVSGAVLWLVSDAARYVTGVTLPVDGGLTAR